MGSVFLHYIRSSVALILIVCLFAPAFVKIAHALTDHESLECKAQGTTHVHQVEFDCDFQKFKISPQYYSTYVPIDTGVTVVTGDVNFGNYVFLGEHRLLPFGLRAPPSVSS